MDTSLVSVYEKQAADLKQQLAASEASCYKLKNEQQLLQDELAKTKASLASLQSSQRQAEWELTSANAQISKLKSMIDEKEQKAAGMEQAQAEVMSRLKARVEDLGAALASEKAYKAKLQADLLAAQTVQKSRGFDYDLELAKSNRLSASIEQVEARRKALCAEVVDLKQDKVRQGLELKSKEKEIKRLLTRIARLQREGEPQAEQTKAALLPLEKQNELFIQIEKAEVALEELLSQTKLGIQAFSTFSTSYQDRTHTSRSSSSSSVLEFEEEKSGSPFDKKSTLIELEEKKALRASNDWLKEKRLADQHSISTLQERLLVRQQELSSVRSQLKLLENAISTMGDLSVVEAIQEQINKTSSAEYQTLMAQETFEVQQNDAIRAELAALQQEGERLRREKAELEKSFSTYEGATALLKFGGINLQDFEAGLKDKINDVSGLRRKIEHAVSLSQSCQSQSSVPQSGSSERQLQAIRAELQMRENELRAATEQASSEKKRSDALLSELNGLIQTFQQSEEEFLAYKLAYEKELGSLREALAGTEITRLREQSSQKPSGSPSSTPAPYYVENRTKTIILQNQEILIRQLKLQVAKAKTETRAAKVCLAIQRAESGGVEDVSMEDGEDVDIWEPMTKLKEEHEREMEKKDSAISELKSMITLQEKKRADLERACLEYVESIKSKAQAAVNSIRSELDNTLQAKKQLSNQISSLTAELTKAKQPGDAMADKERIATLEDRIVALESQIEETSLQNNCLIRESRALKETTAQQLRLLQDELDRANSLYKFDQASAKAWMEQEMTQLTNENYVNVNKLADMTRKVANLENRNEALLHEVRRQQTLSKVDAAAAKLRFFHNTSEVVQNWQTKFHKCNAELTVVKMKLKDAQEKALAQAKERQAPKQEKAGSSDEVISLKGQLALVKCDFDQLLAHSRKAEDLNLDQTAQSVFIRFSRALKRSRTLIEMITLTLEGSGYEEAPSTHTTSLPEEERSPVRKKRQRRK